MSPTVVYSDVAASDVKRQVGCGRRVPSIEGREPEAAGLVPDERRVVHAERLEHGALHVGLERFAGDLFDQQLQQRVAAARVLNHCDPGAMTDTARCRSPRRRVRRPRQRILELCTVDAGRESRITESVRQTRGVAEQAPDRYAVVVEPVSAAIASASDSARPAHRDRPARLDERHDGPGRYPLAERRHLKQGVRSTGSPTELMGPHRRSRPRSTRGRRCPHGPSQPRERARS